MITPSSLAFGNVDVGSSQTMTLTLANTGPASLQLTSVTFPTAPFAPVAPLIGTGTVIPAGGTVTQAVRFTPTKQGAASGTLRITADTGQGTFTVTLTGTGKKPRR